MTTPFLPQRQASELPPPPPLPVAAPGERQHSAVLAALAAQSSPREQLRPVSGWGRLIAALLEPILMVVTLGVGWLIWAVIISGGGQTPAKQVMRHRVVLYGTARPVGFGRMFFMRYLFGGFIAWFAFSLTFGIIMFMPFWDRANRNVWDRVSNTQVVRA